LEPNAEKTFSMKSATILYTASFLQAKGKYQIFRRQVAMGAGSTVTIKPKHLKDALTQVVEANTMAQAVSLVVAEAMQQQSLPRATMPICVLPVHGAASEAQQCIPPGFLPVHGAASVWSHSNNAWRDATVRGVALPGAAHEPGSVYIQYVGTSSHIVGKAVARDQLSLVSLPGA